jgi:hypothetical protein
MVAPLARASSRRHAAHGRTICTSPVEHEGLDEVLDLAMPIEVGLPAVRARRDGGAGRHGVPDGEHGRGVGEGQILCSARGRALAGSARRRRDMGRGPLAQGSMLSVFFWRFFSLVH